MIVAALGLDKNLGNTTALNIRALPLRFVLRSQSAINSIGALSGCRPDRILPVKGSRVVGEHSGFARQNMNLTILARESCKTSTSFLTLAALILALLLCAAIRERKASVPKRIYITYAEACWHTDNGDLLHKGGNNLGNDHFPSPNVKRTLHSRRRHIFETAKPHIHHFVAFVDPDTLHKN